MFKKFLFSFSVLLLIVVDCGFAENEIKFLVPDFPPYTFEKDGQIQGSGVDLVNKVMKEANLPFSMKIVPNYGRAVEDTKKGSADGFFLASKNAERDEIAIFSDPLTINRWCWFFPPGSNLVDPKEPAFKDQAKVGTILNSNLHKWLLEKGYNVSAEPSNVENLYKMLKAGGRMNVVFLAEAVFLDMIAKQGEKAEDYKKIIQVEQPFGIYLSKKYVSEHTGIMEKINIAVNKVKPKD